MDITKTDLIRTRPVAKFRYRGSHSKPVRRVVLITESNKQWFKGYEIREGNTTREVTDDAPVKTFALDKIADCEGETSLERLPLTQFSV